jgi:AcrR family transcriptional regulator
MPPRQYRLKRRATSQQETRERIVDAAVALHAELGPAATTISALAQRAGVQRLTVYRHFQSEREIIEACSSKWLSLHPPPDLAGVAGSEPVQRTRARLCALYDYYSENQQMLNSLHRDLGKIPAVDAAMAAFDQHLSAYARALLEGWAPGKSKRLRATAGHAVRFTTWQSLHEQGLDPRRMAGLVTDWIRGLKAPAPGRAR